MFVIFDFRVGLIRSTDSFVSGTAVLGQVAVLHSVWYFKFCINETEIFGQVDDGWRIQNDSYRAENRREDEVESTKAALHTRPMGDSVA